MTVGSYGNKMQFYRCKNTLLCVFKQLPAVLQTAACNVAGSCQQLCKCTFFHLITYIHEPSVVHP